MTTVLAKSSPCPKCGKVFEHKNPSLLPRMLGTHMRCQHGIKGARHEVNSAYYNKTVRLKMNPAQTTQATAPTIKTGPHAGEPLKMDPASVRRRKLAVVWRANARRKKLEAMAAVQSSVINADAMPVPKERKQIKIWNGKPVKMDPLSVARRLYQKTWRENNPKGKMSRTQAMAKARAVRWGNNGNHTDIDVKPVPANPFPISFCPHCGRNLQAHIAAGSL